MIQNDEYFTFRNYGGYQSAVDHKLNKVYRIYRNTDGPMLTNYDSLKVLFGVVGMLALITWMFKNVSLLEKFLSGSNNDSFISNRSCNYSAHI